MHFSVQVHTHSFLLMKLQILLIALSQRTKVTLFMSAGMYTESEMFAFLRELGCKLELACIVIVTTSRASGCSSWALLTL